MAVILLNGPPGSGKDLGAWIIRTRILLNCSHMKFAQPLKEATHALFGLSRSQVKMMEENKDTILPFTSPYTPRQLYISMSEEYVKPTLGTGFFGTAALNQMKRFANPHIVVSDCGFDEEVKEFVSEHPKGPVFLIELSRPDCSFIHDSRNYLFSDVKAMLHGCVHIHNEYDEELYQAQLTRALRAFGFSIRGEVNDD